MKIIERNTALNAGLNIVFTKNEYVNLMNGYLLFLFQYPSLSTVCEQHEKCRIRYQLMRYRQVVKPS
jgi:hypothetical protein